MYLLTLYYRIAADAPVVVAANREEFYDHPGTPPQQDGLAAVQGKTCVGCATEITSQMQNDLRSGRLVLCKSCGRILYLPE